VQPSPCAVQTRSIVSPASWVLSDLMDALLSLGAGIEEARRRVEAACLKT
jgi:hypothetical protein